MDRVGYKLHWNELEGAVPQKRINVAPHIWDMSLGESFFRDFQFKDIICKKIKEDVQDLSDDILRSQFVVPPAGDTFGHMMVRDTTVTRINNENTHIPIMPNYVRDLAGRIICIAECFPVQKLPSLTGRFPKNSFHIDENYEGFDLIENVFFSSFRTLDPSTSERHQYAYSKVNLYPYKLRVDTFYQDGWKVPQTELLFVKEVNNKEEFKSALDDFNKKWDSFENKNDYEAFYESCGGEEYFNSLYESGITLIPTFEAYNATCIVDRDFNLVDYNNGLVVNYFHDVAEYKDSDLPSGSIIEVLEPGYVTEFEIRKAKVIASNGKNYDSKNAEDPTPLCPNLRLPHQRSSGKWGAVYLPTHPKHFEKPAIWGWDSKTGMFLQESGPIWDPLHYYYESTDIIIDEFQREVLDENYWFYSVPEQMKQRFYPIVPFAGFDIWDMEEKRERYRYIVRPFTVCKRYHDDRFSCGIVYHPMPVEFEFELDSWFAPELSPEGRVSKEIPLNIRNLLAPVCQVNLSAREYKRIQSENSKNNLTSFDDDRLFRNTLADPKKDYPYLIRYYDEVASINKVVELFRCKLLFDRSLELEGQSEYLQKADIPVKLDSFIPDINLAYYEFKHQCFIVLHNRYKLFMDYYDEYLMASWNMVRASELFDLVSSPKEENLQSVQYSSVAIMQPPEF